jgi:uncharacterized RDD family membrane protein YckC
LEKPALTRIPVSHRIVAKSLDFVFVVALATLLPYPLGPLTGFLYSLFGDGIRSGPFVGQSVGKKLVGLRVINRKTGEPAGPRESLFRNAPVGVATFFSIIPIWGWIILTLLGFPLLVLEVYLMFTVEEGHRLGDVMGDTEVVSAA